MKPRVYIILVTWNNWRDTLECLESLLRVDYKNQAIIVVDNASSDGTPDLIARWATGELPPPAPTNLQLAMLSSPAVPKPIPLNAIRVDRESEYDNEDATDLTLLIAPHNGGFGAGNNIGIHYALSRGDCEYVWLLNNDTVVQPDSLTLAVEYMQTDSRIGICGSTLLEYRHPERIQARGGIAYDPWHARGVHIGAGDPDNRLDPKEVQSIERRMSAVQGAAMLASADYLQRIGVLPEEFFLYFEEMEWAARANGQFRFGYAQASRVYHKEGGTVEYKPGSYTAHYYFTRNRIRFTRQRYPRFLWLSYLHVVLVATKRLVRGEIDTAKIMFRAIWDA